MRSRAWRVRGLHPGPHLTGGVWLRTCEQAQVERASCALWGVRGGGEGWGGAAQLPEAGCWPQQEPLLPSPTILVENMQMI